MRRAMIVRTCTIFSQVSINKLRVIVSHIFISE